MILCIGLGDLDLVEVPEAWQWISCSAVNGETMEDLQNAAVASIYPF
jgi:hypothetical protein